jgi:putative exosortase-associated protein (TIGR04073 family)
LKCPARYDIFIPTKKGGKMAKKIVAAIVVLLLIASFATPGYCDGPIKKLGRGVCNILTCPFELFLQIASVNKCDGPMAGITYGVGKGLVWVLVRGVVGAYEVVTFPLPLPQCYRPILTDPEFIFEDMNW